MSKEVFKKKTFGCEITSIRREADNEGQRGRREKGQQQARDKRKRHQGRHKGALKTISHQVVSFNTACSMQAAPRLLGLFKAFRIIKY